MTANAAEIAPARSLNNVDGSPPIHAVLRVAIQDPATPPEVRVILLDLQSLPADKALLEARLFAKALDDGDTGDVAPAVRRRALRQACRDWRMSLPRCERRRSADKLVRITTDWADAELDAEIRRDV